MRRITSNYDTGINLTDTVIASGICIGSGAITTVAVMAVRGIYHLASEYTLAGFNPLHPSSFIAGATYCGLVAAFLAGSAIAHKSRGR